MVYVVTTDAANARKHARMVLANRNYLDGNVEQIANSVPDLASLTALSGLAAADGTVVWVDKLHRLFAKDPTASALSPGQVVASSTPGVWRSLGAAFNPKAGYWAARTDWHIDAVAGTVEGVGSAADPISSWAELMARINGQQLPPGVTISLHSDLAEYIDARALIPDPTSGVVITGQPAAVDLVPGATVATYTGESLVAPGEAPRLTSAAIADWTPWVGFRLRFTSGPAAGAYSSVAAVNPGGAGLNVARIPAPVLANYANPTYPVPVAGNSFVLEQLPTVLGYHPPRSNGGVQDVTLSDVAFPAPVSPGKNRITGGNVVLFGCILDRCLIACNEARLQGCRVGALSGSNSNLNNGNYFYNGCTLYFTLIDSWRSDCDHVVFQKGVFMYDGSHTVHHSGAFDSSASGLIVAAGSRVNFFGRFYGYGNASYGVDMPNGVTGANYDSKPLVTGTLGDNRIAGVVNDWAAIPLVAGNLSGIVTP